jgi:hypothetical protein
MVEKWEHSEETEGRKVADELVDQWQAMKMRLWPNGPRLFGQVMCKGFLDRLRERLNDESGN